MLTHSYCSCVADLFLQFWCLLLSITEQIHGNMESIFWQDTKNMQKKNGCSRNRAGFQMASYARKKKTKLIPTATDHAYLSFTSNATIESAEWNNLLFGYHILQISVGLAYMQTLNGHSRLVCVLEVHTKIRTSRFTRLCWILWIGCVPSHLVLFYLP